MNRTSALTLTASVHDLVRRHLFPGDGLEAAAILICARTPGPRVRWLANRALLVPYDACVRRHEDGLVWPGAFIEDAIDEAEGDGHSLVLIHSHPGGYFAFSDLDDQSDRSVMPGLFEAIEQRHGSAIMIPDGSIRARHYGRDLVARSFDLVTVAGDDLHRWWEDHAFVPTPLAFTSATTQELGRLSACVVGVSGIGSIVAEQLARLGFGEVILIDFDKLEIRNLNRILNSTRDGASRGEPKVHAFAKAIETYRGAGVAVPLEASILTREAVLLASQADVLFSCVDTLEARYVVDLIASTFLIPLFDAGVAIPTRKADGEIAIADVCGRVDYIQPGGSTLLDRGVYDPAMLRAEYLRAAAPASHGDEVRAGYLKGLIEQAPSVIMLNMRAAASCVMEFVARFYPFRHEPNATFARTEFSLAASEEEHTAEGAFTKTPSILLGRGDKEPLLGLAQLRQAKARKSQ